MERRVLTSPLRRIALLFFALAALCVLGPREARADHSLGNSCVTCHTLRSAKVVVGSRNVLLDRVEPFPIYNTDGWYCGTPWFSDAQNQPLDCSACHDQDIALEISVAKGGRNNPGPAQGSAHPVAVSGDDFLYEAPETPRIVCGDCHSGDGGALLPATLCTKNDTDGYPNHKNTVVSFSVPPGQNNLVQNPPRLFYSYDNSNSLWNVAKFTVQTGNASTVLCFICHDADASTAPPFSPNSGSGQNLGFNENGMKNILADYNATGGGHNVPGPGTGVGGNENKKLPCYACHDAHAATNTDQPTSYNTSLLINYADIGNVAHPFDSTSTFSIADYGFSSAVTDRVLCTKCHGAGTVEGQAVVGVLNPIPSANLVFGFHKDAHSVAATSGNCLQQSGGCHPSPHYTAPYDCFSCHSNPTSFGNTVTNGKLLRVTNVLSEFGDILNRPANGIVSKHDVPYSPGNAANPNDMSLPANNGCLNCHNVPGTAAGKVAILGGGAVNPGPFGDREALHGYDDFCFSCHDGEDASNGNIQFGSYDAPFVKKYFNNGGHGTGFDPSYSLKSGTAKPKVPCLECHVYHGSTMYKLLPGNTQTTDWQDAAPFDKGGRVIKGFRYSDGTGVEVTSVKESLGGVSDTSKIDYRDYTLKDNHQAQTRMSIKWTDVNPTDNTDYRQAIKFANYTTPWNTYYERVDNSTAPAEPQGTRIQFGVSGDLANTACTDTTTMDDYLTSPNLGFCDACHMYDNATDGTTRKGVVAFTHQGLPDNPAKPNNFCDGAGTRGELHFQKDCTECHDPHGSGSENQEKPNWYMIRGKIATGKGAYADPPWAIANVYNVVLDDPDGDGIFIGTDSLEEADFDNRDDLCAVCHTKESGGHNLREVANTTDHMVGTNCIQCHNHAKAPIGFPQGSSCNACHGYPPRPSGTTGNVPPDENYTGGGSFHVTHVNFLLAKLGYSGDVLNTFVRTKELCGPCHGDEAGVTDHLTSPTSCQLPDVWSTATCRPFVSIKDRLDPAYYWGTATYGGNTLPTVPSGAAMNRDNSRCADLNCHGRPSASDPGYISWADYNLVAGEVANLSNVSDGEVRSRVCEQCHDETPATLRVWDGAATANLVYTAVAVDAAANYFGTLSGYGRGGHGDRKLGTVAQGGKGYDIDSDTNHSPPVDCTACHDPGSAHFPAPASSPGNLHRLRNTTIEDGTTAGLCNECHTRATYPGTLSRGHHPSYIHGTNFSAPVNANAAQEVMNNVDDGTNWFLNPLTLIYEQTEYGAGGTADGFSFPGNPDRFIDWYNRCPNGTDPCAWTPGNESHTWSPEPKGVFFGQNGRNDSSESPKVVLPLEKNLLNTGNSNRVLCVSCHNPHGTDLYVFDPLGGDQDIADFNMLRLEDTDNTLCNACH